MGARSFSEGSRKGGEPDQYQGAVSDITERRGRRSPEISGRVSYRRNSSQDQDNLQVISSLLDLQAESLEMRRLERLSGRVRVGSYRWLLSMSSFIRKRDVETLNFTYSQIGANLFQIYRLDHPR